MLSFWKEGLGEGWRHTLEFVWGPSRLSNPSIRSGSPGLTWRGAKEPGHEEAQGGHVGSQKQPPLLLH